MVYLGSKQRFCKYIVPIINSYIKENNIKNFYDIFCGGANLTDKINCKNIFASDLSPTLIALHKQAQEDFSKIPTSATREEWEFAREEYRRLLNNFPICKWKDEAAVSLYRIGCLEWYVSYARAGFKNGYACPSEKRDYYKEAYRNHKKQAEQKNYKKINFTNEDYRFLQIEPNAVIYCDPPYKDTRTYEINKNFDYEEFYDWLKEKSKTNPIFISEQEMPPEFNCIWSKDDVIRQTTIHNDYKACEKLFFVDNRKKSK